MMPTPTPWAQDGAYVVATVEGVQRDIADCARPLNSSTALGKENAALIVHRVNVYDEMLAALIEADRLYSTYGLLAQEYACGKWINSVRDAISKASPIDTAPDGTGV